MAKKKAAPTFFVRFVAPDLSPDKIPVRLVSEALSAIQDLACGRDSFETPKVPQDKTIGLVNVRSGSAVYSCVSRDPAEARDNLSRLGVFLAGDMEDSDDDLVVSALRPIEALSNVAKAIGGHVEVSLAAKRTALFQIEDQAFGRLSSRLFISGKATIIGRVERVGGATGMKCLMRIPDRRTGLYCKVKGRKLAQRLGQCLYETIAARGDVVWIHKTWRIYEFTIHDFTQPRLKSPGKAIKKLRRAGLSAWDNVENPEALIEELRQ